jgi:two-component system, OmpR family, response regulator
VCSSDLGASVEKCVRVKRTRYSQENTQRLRTHIFLIRAVLMKQMICCYPFLIDNIYFTGLLLMYYLFQKGYRLRVLLVEDDMVIASFIIKGLKEAGYTVDHTSNGQDGLHSALTETYDVAIVDIMLPKLDGLSVIAEIRKRGRNTPVIILSAKQSVEDRIKGLQTGSDDYLTKPFSFSELLARLQALIRRANGVSEATRLTVADLTMDLLAREVTRSGVKIDLQPREFSLLEYLMRNAGRVVSKTMIMEHVWDYNFDPQTNVVEARMSKLRDKIDRDYACQLIHTIRGAGYIIKEPA